MTPGVTMAEIAKRLGISKTTVSLALANRPGVSEQMRQSVLDMAVRLGYQRRGNPPLASTRRRAVLVILQKQPIQTDITGLAVSYLDGIQAAADDLKLRVVLTTVGIGERIADNSMDIVRSEPVAIVGALLMGLKEQDEPVLAQLRDLSVPVVVVNRHWPDAELSFVSVDYVRAQAAAVRYLGTLGHRSIAFVGLDADEGYSWFKQRKQGYVAALAAERCPLDPRHVICASTATQAIGDLLAKAPDVTAICAANDTTALALLQELERRSIAVPQAISIIGFDNDSALPVSHPPLTTIGYNSFDIGYLATRVLAEQANQNEVVSTAITVRTHLVVRQSCAAVGGEAVLSSIEQSNVSAALDIPAQR